MKMADLVNGRGTARVCSYCMGGYKVVGKANIDVRAFTCIAPRSRDLDECRQYITEPCLMSDYESCLIKALMKQRR